MNYLTVLIFACTKCGSPIVHPAFRYETQPNIEAEYDSKPYSLTCGKCKEEGTYYGRDRVETAKLDWPHSKPV